MQARACQTQACSTWLLPAQPGVFARMCGCTRAAAAGDNSIQANTCHGGARARQLTQHAGDHQPRSARAWVRAAAAGKLWHHSDAHLLPRRARAREPHTTLARCASTHSTQGTPSHAARGRTYTPQRQVSSQGCQLPAAAARTSSHTCSTQAARAPQRQVIAVSEDFTCHHGAHTTARGRRRQASKRAAAAGECWCGLLHLPPQRVRDSTQNTQARTRAAAAGEAQTT